MTPRPSSAAPVGAQPGAPRALSTLLGVLVTGALVVLSARGDWWALVWAPYGVVGALILWQRPGNRIGWLSLEIGTCFALSDVAQHALDRAATPLSVLALQLGFVAGGLAFVGVVVLAVVFPTGSPVGWSGRIVVRLGAVLAVLITLGVMLDPAVPTGAKVAGPLAVTALAPVTGVIVVQMAQVVPPVLLVLAAASVWVRWRWSSGVERQQLRWFLVSLAVLSAAFVVITVLQVVDLLPGWMSVLLVLAGWTVPAAIAVAVTRYRLYDLDRLVSRTLSYVVVTALVVAVYALVVASASALLPEGVPSWVVAAATLAAAALVRPLLSRVQRMVDRRFNRERVDAQREIAAFGQALVDQSDPTSASARLMAVTSSVFSPSSTSLWLAEQTR